MDDRLYRSREDRMLLGVAGGMAERYDADPSLIRVLWVLASVFTGGIGILVYIVMGIVVPEDPSGYVPPPRIGAMPTGAGAGAPDPMAELQAQRAAQYADEREARRAERRARRSTASRTGPLIVGILLIAIGAWFLFRRYVPWLDTDILWPVGLVVLGILILVIAIRPRGGDSTGAAGSGS
jgi:phage shock protein C